MSEDPSCSYLQGEQEFPPEKENLSEDDQLSEEEVPPKAKKMKLDGGGKKRDGKV